jgi:hypothetical protein
MAEFRGTLVKLLERGGLVVGDDGTKAYLPRGELLGPCPKVGTRLSYEIVLTGRRPLAVGALRIKA